MGRNKEAVGWNKVAVGWNKEAVGWNKEPRATQFRHPPHRSARCLNCAELVEAYDSGCRCCKCAGSSKPGDCR